MNWLDLVLFVIFIIAIIGGVKNGLIKSFIGLVAFLVGVLLAVRFYSDFGLWLQRFISNAGLASVVAFLLILLGVVLVGAIVGSLFRGLASTIGLGWLDRLGGAVFSLVTTAIVFGGILAILAKYFAELDGAIQGSFLASFLVQRLLPVINQFSPGFGELRDLFSGAIGPF